MKKGRRPAPPEPCRVRQDCVHWHDGAGDSACFKCVRKNAVFIEHFTRSFDTLQGGLEVARANEKLISVVDVLSKLPARDSLIFLRRKLHGDSMTDIASDFGLSRQTVWRIIRSVKLGFKDLTGLSDSTKL